jgi:hypothetical protein
MPRRAPALPPPIAIDLLIASASNARSGGSAGPATVSRVEMADQTHDLAGWRAIRGIRRRHRARGGHRQVVFVHQVHAAAADVR